jgi:putative transposase
MTNHVHFVAIPDQKDSIWKAFHRCHSIYAMNFNKKYGFAGHLWQGRPFSCVLDEQHLWAAVRYVERNPVRASMVARAEEYRWSSARAHCGLASDLLLDPAWLRIDNTPNWSGWLTDDQDVELQGRLRKRTFSGMPCGDDDFVEAAERALGRQLAPKKSGPKPKARKSETLAMLAITNETGN